MCEYPIPIYKGKKIYYLGCPESLLGDCEKDFYFSPDGLGNKQAQYIKKHKS